ncbi:MAG: hypothetical protein KUG78_09460 [Kangiellaceae bacterium]|nr:hypothetical protein [Kangiellaceae bacterium]
MKNIFLFIASVVLASCATPYKVDKNDPTALVKFNLTRKLGPNTSDKVFTYVYINNSEDCAKNYLLGNLNHKNEDNKSFSVSIEAENPVVITFRTDTVWATNYASIIFEAKTDASYLVNYNSPSLFDFYRTSGNSLKPVQNLKKPKKVCRF